MAKDDGDNSLLGPSKSKGKIGALLNQAKSINKAGGGRKSPKANAQKTAKALGKAQAAGKPIRRNFINKSGRNAGKLSQSGGDGANT
jgi:hypothetical protein